VVDEGVLHEGGVKAALHDFMEGLPAKAVAALRPIMGDSSIRGATLRAKVGGVLKRNGVPGMVLGGSSTQIVIDNWDTFHGSVTEGCDQCMGDALKSLKAANAADLKDKPGAAGAKAHKRLHKTIGKVLKSK
jgi:hypothetical protein